jgi:hypothetical protein
LSGYSNAAAQQGWLSLQEADQQQAEEFAAAILTVLLALLLLQ